MVRVLIGLLVVGGRRLEHLKYLATDPLLHRFARMQACSTARTKRRCLKRPLSLQRVLQQVHGLGNRHPRGQ